MNIGTIVTVGIDNKDFIQKLEGNGYTLFPVDGIASVLDISTPFDLMILKGELLDEVSHTTLEHLYFVNNSTPVTVLIKDHDTVYDTRYTTLSKSSLGLLYDFEITTGAIYPRIDQLFIHAKLNSQLSLLQQNFTKQETLKNEITLREQILNHERGINANITASITAGLIIFDLNGIIILANDPAKQVLKNTSSDIIGSPYTTVLPRQIREIIDSVKQEMTAHDIRPCAIKCKIDNSIFNIYCYRMLDYQNQPSGILMLINDITEQENLNVLLYRSEKLATVGTMLSGIAHELRNPLSIISARVQRALTKKTYEEEWLEKSFTSIKKQTLRCASIVNSLLNFTRNTATNAGYHKVSDVLDETLTYVDYQNSFDNITINKQYNEELSVFGDRSRFVQIFLNLITNAADAMEGNGTLTISTSQNQASSTLVEINDTGPGIDKTIAQKIFDPFFTTKEPGKGTGLGLAIVYKIVQESNGRIWLNSNPGRTSFYVELPSEKERSYDGTHTAR